ncbi:uncharacterized protein EMH_0100410 [Eimeria mitis]|uniref:Uncharacterized protein n=1 Tax=Eimeria mitis TaxID=44415 RepID=U6KJV9_9EIME|nr:uncharacterized protein EMH_0100410 [Eimeria mitis]CDJ35738.1 hypothetical protein, conserved [Eimeria mitis]
MMLQAIVSVQLGPPIAPKPKGIDSWLQRQRAAAAALGAGAGAAAQGQQQPPHAASGNEGLPSYADVAQAPHAYPGVSSPVPPARLRVPENLLGDGVRDLDLETVVELEGEVEKLVGPDEPLHIVKEKLQSQTLYTVFKLKRQAEVSSSLFKQWRQTRKPDYGKPLATDYDALDWSEDEVWYSDDD